MVQFGPANSWLFIASPLPAELSAASVLINFWVGPDKISNAVWITICLIVTVTINLLGAGVLVNRCSKDNSDYGVYTDNKVLTENASSSSRMMCF
jgi:hypothetical protein